VFYRADVLKMAIPKDYSSQAHNVQRRLADVLRCARYDLSCAICDVMHAKLELFPAIKLHEAP